MNLREYRYNKGYQRKFIANKVGISCRHLNDIEVSAVNLTDKVADKLSEVYGVGKEEIFNMYKEGEQIAKQ